MPTNVVVGNDGKGDRKPFQGHLTTLANKEPSSDPATFSAPKSVSLAALVGGDDRVREAHHEAVTAALAELERYTQARIGGNNAAHTTGKFIVAKFEHDTARPVDGYAAPQLHTHAVVFNVTELASGKTRALQERALFDTQQFATAVYQSELTFRLRNLGYQLEAGRSGAPEIAGFTREYLDASSPRSQQIREYLEANGLKGPEAAQIAAHGTRDGKEVLSTGQVMAAHYKVAVAHGDQAIRIVTEARERAQTQPEQRITDAPSRAQPAVTYAKERGFEREAVSDERLLMRDALRRGMGDVTYPEIRKNFDRRTATGEFRSVVVSSTLPAAALPRPKRSPWNAPLSKVSVPARTPWTRLCAARQPANRQLPGHSSTRGNVSRSRRS